MRSQSEGSGLLGSDRAATKRSRHHSGSSALLTVGPEAAGGPVPPEPPSAREGGDLGGRAAPLGRLVQGVGRQGGPLEPLAALSDSGAGRGLAGSQVLSAAGLALQAGQFCPTTTQAFPGAGDPGRAAGRGIAAPD